MSTLKMIDQENYDKITLRWTTLLNKNGGTEDLRPFFYQDGMKLTAVHFDASTILYLISSEAIATVKARFAITGNDGEEGLFNIVLYGVDRNDKINSAFYLGDPYAEPVTGHIDPGAPQCQLPSSIGSVWITNWLENDIFVSNLRFKNIYGYLEGYNFELSDFIDSTFLDTCSGLSVTLALHELYRPGTTDVTKSTFTLNLVLQGILKEGVTQSENVERADGLYDISAPSPPY